MRADLVSPAPPPMGQAFAARVYLTSAAPQGSAVVSLSSPGTATLGHPGMVAIPAGQSSIAFTVTAYPCSPAVNDSVCQDQFTATDNGVTRTAPVSVFK